MNRLLCWRLCYAALLLGVFVAPAQAAEEEEKKAEPEPPPGCECSDRVKPLDAFERYDMIFFGQASFIGNSGTGEDLPQDEFVEFSVEGIWKGPKQRRLRVHTADGDPHCAFRFKLGANYLVYARHEDIAYSPRYRTSACARTAAASHSLPDLAILGVPDERLDE